MPSTAAIAVLSASLCLAAAGEALAQDGVGRGYQQVPSDTFAVIAEVRAKPGMQVLRGAE
jgi:hypothetical protein